MYWAGSCRRSTWVQLRQRGSHRRLVKGPLKRTWAFHDGMDLGTVQMTQVARQFGNRLDGLRKLLQESQMVMKLRVEYAYDPESRNWSFRVPSLGIVGGADSREEAEKRVVDAVAFTLEGEEDGSPLAQTEVRYLNVEIGVG